MARDLATLLAETVTIESFGAVGDGVRDDTAAFQAALASGRPLRLGARTYIVTGALTAEGDVFIVGSPGVTKVCRGPGSANGVWFDITGPSFFAS
ncbi:MULTISPECIES: glycosyl hydrolase family 28-related protein, partial [Streptomyces]